MIATTSYKPAQTGCARFAPCSFSAQEEHFFSRFQLFRLEGFQPFGGLSAVKSGRWHSSLARLSAATPGYTGSRAFAGRPAPAGSQKLAFQLVHFQFGSFRASLVLSWRSMASATTSFCSSRRICTHRDPLRSVRSSPADAVRFAQVQVIAGRLIIRFQIAFGTVCSASSRAISTCLYCSAASCYAKYVTRDETPGLCRDGHGAVGVTHVVRRHVVGSFADQMLNRSRSDWVTRIASSVIRFSPAPLPCPGTLYARRCFPATGVAQRTGNGTGDPAIQRSFDQR